MKFFMCYDFLLIAAEVFPKSAEIDHHYKRQLTLLRLFPHGSAAILQILRG